MTQDNTEFFIRMRAQELYQEWCNDPDSSVADTIAKGMLDAIRHSKTHDVTDELAKELKEVADAWAMSEGEMLKHLISLGKLASTTLLYIQKQDGSFVELGEIE